MFFAAALYTRIVRVLGLTAEMHRAFIRIYDILQTLLHCRVHANELNIRHIGAFWTAYSAKNAVFLPGFVHFKCRYKQQ